LVNTAVIFLLKFYEFHSGGPCERGSPPRKVYCTPPPAAGCPKLKKEIKKGNREYVSVCDGSSAVIGIGRTFL